MKSKLFLEEGEISRILNMHKKAIQEQINVNGDEVETNKVQMDEELRGGNGAEQKGIRMVGDKTEVTLNADVSLEGSNGGSELKIFKGAILKGIPGKSQLKSDGKIAAQYVDTLTGAAGTSTNNRAVVYYNCKSGKLRTEGNTNDYYAGIFDYSVGQKTFYPEMAFKGMLTAVCYNNAKTSAKDTENNAGGGGATIKSKCPKLEKTYLDKGYVMITQKRYQELANDKTRVRKYKWCPISKTNLYFAKVVGGGSGGGGKVGGGSGGGGSLPFEYNEVMTAINTKCPATAGGGSSTGTGIDVDLDSQKEIPTPKMPTEVYNGL